MTEDIHYMPFSALPDLVRRSHTNITLQDFSACPFDLAPTVAKEAFDCLIDGGTLEFEVPDFGQMITFYNHSLGVNLFLWKTLEDCAGRVWDERGIAKVLLEAGFYRVWTGKVDGLQPCWMWVKGLKFASEPGAPIDGSSARPEGSPGED